MAAWGRAAMMHTSPVSRPLFNHKLFKNNQGHEHSTYAQECDRSALWQPITSSRCFTDIRHTDHAACCEAAVLLLHSYQCEETRSRRFDNTAGIEDELKLGNVQA